MDETVVITDCGDSGVVAKAVAGDAERRWEVVHCLADAIEEAGLEGVYGVVPAYDSLLVEFDCARTDHSRIRDAVREAADVCLAEGYAKVLADFARQRRVGIASENPDRMTSSLRHGSSDQR